MSHLNAHHLARTPVDVPSPFPDPRTCQGLHEGHGDGRRFLVGLQHPQVTEDQGQNGNTLGGGNGEVILKTAVEVDGV